MYIVLSFGVRIKVIATLCGLQDDFCHREPGLTDDTQRILQELTVLHKTENAKVALRARQVIADI